MEKKNYDLTEITRMLLKMRANCALRKEGEAYDDPEKMEKYDALDAVVKRKMEINKTRPWKHGKEENA